MAIATPLATNATSLIPRRPATKLLIAIVTSQSVSTTGMTANIGLSFGETSATRTVQSKNRQNGTSNAQRMPSNRSLLVTLAFSVGPQDVEGDTLLFWPVSWPFALRWELRVLTVQAAITHIPFRPAFYPYQAGRACLPAGRSVMQPLSPAATQAPARGDCRRCRCRRPFPCRRRHRHPSPGRRERSHPRSPCKCSSRLRPC